MPPRRAAGTTADCRSETYARRVARRLTLVTAAACLAAAGLAPAAQAAAPLRTATFKTPSGNIGCAVHAFSGWFLRCDILSGLVPEPLRRCEGDWTGASLTPSGRSGAVCAGDTVYDRRAPVLAYGRVWTRNGFRCVSRRTGLTCTNTRGHGFVLAREHSRFF